MGEEKPSFLDWVIAGLGLGIGFGLASMMFGVITFATWKVYMDYELRAAVEVAKEAREERNARYRHQQSEKPARYETVERRMPPLSRERCLESTGGVANEEYARCRSGYAYTERVRVQ